VKAVNRYSLGLLFLIFLVGCGTARPLMPVAESLESASVLQVKRAFTSLSSKPLSFGEWQMTHYERDGFPGETRWSFGGWPVWITKSKGSLAYRFVMSSTDDEEWACSCQHPLDRRDLGLGVLGEAELTYEESLECDLQRVGDEAAWKLRVHGNLGVRGEGYSGTLADGSRSLSLEPSNEIEGLGRLPGPPLGYHFVREGEEIASAELIRPGMVRIGDDAGPDRDVIATAMAALLMQPQAE
jgi:hypothetical protein